MKYADKKLGRYREGVVPLHKPKPIAVNPKKKPKKRRTQRFKNMKSIYGGVCAECVTPITKGSLIKYYYEEKKATHSKCKLTFDQ